MSTPFPRKLQTGGNGAEFRVEIALGLQDSADSAIWAPDPNEGHWDEQTWNGSELYWVDVTSRAQLVQWTQGRDRWDQRFRTGAATFVLDNDDGVFNPDGGAIGDLRFRPGRWIRVLGRVNSDPYISMWQGYIDSIQDIYSEGAAGITARIFAYDHMGNMAIDDPLALETPVPAELSSERVNRILDLSDWNEILRDIQTGIYDVQASDLAQSRLEEVQITADSEGGAFYVDKRGVVTFRNRDYLTGPGEVGTIPILQGTTFDDLTVGSGETLVAGPNVTLTGTFPNRSASPQFSIGDPSGDGVQVGEARTDWSTQRVSNDVQMSRSGGNTQRVTDDASIGLYQRRTFRRLNLENVDDADVLFLATRFLEAQRFDHLRIDSLTTIALDETAARDLIGMELTDQVRVTIRTLRGWSYTMNAWINRMTFVVSPDDWEVTVQVDNIDRTDPFDRSGFTDGFDDGFGN